MTCQDVVLAAGVLLRSSPVRLVSDELDLIRFGIEQDRVLERFVRELCQLGEDRLEALWTVAGGQFVPAHWLPADDEGGRKTRWVAFVRRHGCTPFAVLVHSVLRSLGPDLDTVLQ